MEKRYDISIIIPVFNVEKYCDSCLESVCKQTKKNIEIVCIDDGSSDGSPEILDEYARIYENIVIVRNGQNYGSLYARKSGVFKARGSYIMFLDGDDFLEKEACEIAYSEIESNNADILQFGMNLINRGSAPKHEIDSFIHFVTPCFERLENDLILKECFENERYNYNLVDKIYRADICKKAFSYLDDEKYCMAEDALAYFLVAYFAKSYMGIPNVLYNYNFGIGISKPGKLDLEMLDKRCSSAESIKAIERFLHQQETFEQYKKVYEKIERRMLLDCFDAWYYRLPSDLRREGYVIYEKHWGKDKLIQGLLYDIENKQFDLDYKSRLIEEKNRRLDHITHSISYKVGYSITYLPRRIRRVIKRMIHTKKNEKQKVEDKIKRFLEIYVPTEACNLKCNYCYVRQRGDVTNLIHVIGHTPKEVRKALSVKRLGGVCLLNFCAGGETLLGDDILPIIKELLLEGHYIQIVTNGTLKERFRELIQWDAEILQRLFIKFSFHFLELKNRDLMDDYFGNVRMVRDKGVSISVELMPCDELVPYIDEIKSVCMENLKALPQLTVGRDVEMKLLSRYSMEDYKKIWEQFYSPMFEYKIRMFGKSMKNFCYAGEWLCCLRIDTGDLFQCDFLNKIDNIYENVKKSIHYQAVGYNCPHPHCWNCHAYITMGVFPDVEAPTYAKMRNRECVDGTTWLSESVYEFFSKRFQDNETNVRYK